MAEAATDTGSSAGNAVMACCSGAVKCGRKVCGCITERIKKLNVRTVSIMLRVINLANAVFLAVASFYAYKDLANTVTRFFLATYIGVFALLLCLFETRVPWTENIIRRNFGFMFTYTGRAVFLIFLGAISFGMIDSSNGAGSTVGFNVVVGAGIATLLNSILNCFIICSHPGFQELSKQAEESFAGNGAAGAGKDPSRMTEEQVRAYLALHPELAAQALSAGVGAAADSSQPHAGAASSVPEWGATATAAAAPVPAAAASASASKESSGGWFGRSKPKAGKSTASPDAEAGGYAPPSVPSAPAKPLDAADSDNPFGGSSSSTSTSAPAPAVTAAPPAPASISPRPAAAVTAAAPAPAAASAPRPPAADLEDNPFAQDNPFDKDGGF